MTRALSSSFGSFRSSVLQGLKELRQLPNNTMKILGKKCSDVSLESVRRKFAARSSESQDSHMAILQDTFEKEDQQAVIRTYSWCANFDLHASYPRTYSRILIASSGLMLPATQFFGIIIYASAMGSKGINPLELAPEQTVDPYFLAATAVLVSTQLIQIALVFSSSFAEWALSKSEHNELIEAAKSADLKQRDLALLTLISQLPRYERPSFSKLFPRDQKEDSSSYDVLRRRFYVLVDYYEKLTGKKFGTI